MEYINFLNGQSLRQGGLEVKFKILYTRNYHAVTLETIRLKF